MDNQARKDLEQVREVIKAHDDGIVSQPAMAVACIKFARDHADNLLDDSPPDTVAVSRDDVAECEFCACVDVCVGVCAAENGDHYLCSRERGHTGQHVACGGAWSHNIASWPQE